MYILWGNRKKELAPNLSIADNQWRFGEGNVFDIAEDKENALANIQFIFQRFAQMTDGINYYVKLRSDYQKGVYHIDDDFKPEPNAPYTELVGAGLFTMRQDVGLMAASGDAHTLVLSSEKAIAVVTGSWHCLKKDVMGNVLDSFLSNGIAPKDITMHIGPGLGMDSYSLDQNARDQLAGFSNWIVNPEGKNLDSESFLKEIFTPKATQKAGNPIKYHFDLVKMLTLWGQFVGLNGVVATNAGNTFDKKSWKEVKQQAVESKSIEPLIKHYAESPYFGARLFWRTLRQVDRILQGTLDKRIPVGFSAEPKQRDEVYKKTGRNGNIVVLSNSLQIMIINLEVESRVSALIKAQQLFAGQMWRQIVFQNESTFSGDDSVCRPIFVNLQAYIEQTFAELLEEGKIKTAVGVIHTSQPATPLCTDGQITPGLVTDAISQDPERLATVLKRPNIIRKFLEAGGTLVTTYPEVGRSQRSTEQLAIFDGLKARYPQHLLDKPLAIDALPRGMSGATYIVEDHQGNKSMFSIMAEQANVQQPSADWGIWFGSINKPKIKERLSILKPFLSQHELIFGCMIGIFDESVSIISSNSNSKRLNS